MNTAELLAREAAAAPGRAAVKDGGRVWSFSELDAAAAGIAAGLSRAGLKAGERAAVFLPPGPFFYAAAFGLFRLGAVPVLIDPGIGFKRLGECLAESAPAAFIGTAKAQLGRLLGRWGRGSVRLLVCGGGYWPGARRLESWLEGSGGAPMHAPRAGETAAILFTSGSTGAPKGVVYTHEIFTAQAELLRRLFAIRPGEVSVPTFPLFGLFDAALGQTVVIPEMDPTRPAAADPRKILAALRAHGAAQLFASPALLDALGRHGEPLPAALRRVISAGAPVAPKILRRLAPLLPEGCQVWTPYGATEALPVSLIGSAEILAETAEMTAAGRGVCVGRPVPGVEAAVIRLTDEAIPRWEESLRLPPGEIGEIAARGAAVTPRYDARPEATALSKIRCDDGSFWHRMGDAGYFDERGRLWFCGRKSQRVETALGTLYTIPCEGVFNAHPAVKRTALVGAGPAGMRVPVLCVELEPGAEPSERLKDELLALGGGHPHTKDIHTVLFHPAFPVDIRHNAKIFRERLAEWAQRRIR